MDRIEREKSVIATMIAEYCRRVHQSSDGTDVMCADCRSLLEYAISRLEHCPQGAHKPSCRRCVIHCYRPAQRESLRQVMSYMGPRMAYLHPIMALRHFFRDYRR